MKIHDLCKVYDEQVVIENLNMSLDDDQIYALMGPSGCGKTTLLHILAGILNVDGGMIDGLDEKKVSMVFQEDRLMGFLTAAENISVVQKSDVTIEAINKVLEEILPKDSLGQKTEEYSGGMKRRVAIARAMLAKSDLILMDEPFTGLDEGTKEQVVSFVKKYRKGRALIFSTHLEEEVEMMGAKKLLL